MAHLFAGLSLGLSQGTWITRDRMVAYPAMMLVLTVAATVFVLWSNGGVMPNGAPFGTDFVSYWVAAREALARGYVLSFAGNATFPANEHLRAACAEAPDGQFLVETDAPYMAPEPFRGARNEPGLVGYTVRAIAEVRGQSPEDLVAEVADTARAVFGLTVCPPFRIRYPPPGSASPTGVAVVESG